MRDFLKRGNEDAKKWSERVDRATAKIGGVDERSTDEVVEALYKVSKKIRAEAKTDDVCDLGIIASGCWAAPARERFAGRYVCFLRVFRSTNKVLVIGQPVELITDAE